MRDWTTMSAANWHTGGTQTEMPLIGETDECGTLDLLAAIDEETDR